jgi:hypothetical protein
MRQPSTPVLAGRESTVPPQAGYTPDANERDLDRGIGKQHYREWQAERDKLAEMIHEAELNLPASPGYLGSAKDLSSSSLSATYRRVHRLERLMADHTEWR